MFCFFAVFLDCHIYGDMPLLYLYSYYMNLQLVTNFNFGNDLTQLTKVFLKSKEIRVIMLGENSRKAIIILGYK
jgi:hypothetical protein